MSIEDARSTLADVYLAGSAVAFSKNVGSVHLHSHQVEAVARIRRSIAELGGAMLCDPAGTGKTYTAMAVATAYHRICVVAPAVLEPMWMQSSRDCSVAIEFVSHEQLSRRGVHDSPFDLVIVDEAHHARNTATKRFAGLSRLVAGKPALLLSATPIHNSRRDLQAVLSLFLGEHAGALSDAELGRCVVRRESLPPADISTMPAIAPLVWLDLPDDDDLPREILSLPPPLPPSDGGDGGALISHSLVRQWASSDAALLGAIRRRLHRAAALIAALDAGTYPSRAELTAWTAAEDSVQLAFAELMAPPATGPDTLLEVIRRHEGGLTRLRTRVERASGRDSGRADAIRGVLATHAGSPVVAFSQYSGTVADMFRRLVRLGGVAALAGSGGKVAGGNISRREIISRFAPRASRAAPPRHSESIRLLLTTDLLSEGVNLQDANVVIHLDLPWTPARMEQRLGRVARIGSSYRQVHSYAMRPPASAEAIAGLERTLERKLGEVSSIASGSFALHGSRYPAGIPTCNRTATIERLRGLLASWRWQEARQRPSGISLACVASLEPGFIAACVRNGGVSIVCGTSSRISDDPADALRFATAACGPQSSVDAATARATVDAIHGWLEASAALADVQRSSSGSPTPRDLAMRQIARIVSRARTHERTRACALAEQARRAVASMRGAHLEKRIAGSPGRDTAPARWLEELIRSADVAGPPHARDSEGRILAVIILDGSGNGNALSRARER